MLCDWCQDPIFNHTDATLIAVGTPTDIQVKRIHILCWYKIVVHAFAERDAREKHMDEASQRFQGGRLEPLSDRPETGIWSDHYSHFPPIWFLE